MASTPAPPERNPPELSRSELYRAQAKETKAENVRTDERVDGFAKGHITSLENTNASQRLQLRLALAFAALQMAVICVLAGHAVGIKIPGLGQFSGGGGTVGIEEGDGE